MTAKHYRCDASEWTFSIAQDNREVVAQIFRCGDRYGPEFRAADQAQLQKRIASWLVLHASHNVGGVLN